MRSTGGAPQIKRLHPDGELQTITTLTRDEQTFGAAGDGHDAFHYCRGAHAGPDGEGKHTVLYASLPWPNPPLWAAVSGGEGPSSGVHAVVWGSSATPR